MTSSLEEALQNVETIVVFAPLPKEMVFKIVDIAAACKVRCFVPNEFGTAPNRDSPYPWAPMRAEIRQYIEKHSELRPIYLYPGFITDFMSLDKGFGIDLRKKTADIYCAEQWISWTTKQDLGRFLVSAILKEATGQVRVCGDVQRIPDIVSLYETKLHTKLTRHYYNLDETHERYKQGKCNIFQLVCAMGLGYVGRGSFTAPEKGLKSVHGLDNAKYQNFRPITVADQILNNVDDEGEEDDVCNAVSQYCAIT